MNDTSPRPGPISVQEKDTQAYKTAMHNVISYKGCESREGVPMKESEISPNLSLLPRCKRAGREGQEKARRRKESACFSASGAGVVRGAVGLEGFY